MTIHYTSLICLDMWNSMSRGCQWLGSSKLCQFPHSYGFIFNGTYLHET
jgi:hypothetical protein